jgi:hypothetical protein
MARRCPPPRSLTILILASLLAGCSGTPLGEGLSRSFPGPGGPSAAGTATDPAGDATTDGAAADDSAATGDATAKPAVTAAKPAQRDATATPADATEGKPAKPPPPKPADRGAAAVPYRLVLRLPLADPAAPAEVVTDALRAAGVSFEVETIERLSAGGEAGKAGAKPAAAGGTGEAAGAETRPAPEPR